MFRKNRRKKNEISVEEAKKLLHNNKRGALAMIGDEGYPYTIPINFFYAEDENRIYFHSSKVGHKIDSLKANNKVCFTTWDDGILEDGDWAYIVSSCVVFGKATLISDHDLGIDRIKKLAMKYYPTEEEVDEEIKNDFHAVQMVAIDIEHISGKRVQEK